MSEIPTKEDLEKLPLRAVVAFAARCARRIQPLYALAEDVKDLAMHARNVEYAIQFAEEFTATNNTNTTYGGDVAVAAANANRAANANFKAANAAYVAGIAVNCVNANAAPTTADAVANTAGNVASAATAANAAANDASAYVAADFNHLRVAVEAGTITSDTPVPLEFFGPMWPGGEPDWYVEGLAKTREILSQQIFTASADVNLSPLKVSARATTPTIVQEEPEDQQPPPPLEVYIDPGDASKETVQEVLDALSDLHRAHGGLGLDFKVDGQLVVAMEGASHE